MNGNIMNKQSCTNAISMIFVFNLQYDSSALFLFRFGFCTSFSALSFLFESKGGIH